jgi:hypothetical protein
MRMVQDGNHRQYASPRLNGSAGPSTPIRTPQQHLSGYSTSPIQQGIIPTQPRRLSGQHQFLDHIPHEQQPNSMQGKRLNDTAVAQQIYRSTVQEPPTSIVSSRMHTSNDRPRSFFPTAQSDGFPSTFNADALMADVNSTLPGPDDMFGTNDWGFPDDPFWDGTLPSATTSNSVHMHGSRSGSTAPVHTVLNKVPCVNCYQNWWENECDEGSPCFNCQAEDVFCMRQRCFNFSSGTCDKGSKCFSVHAGDVRYSDEVRLVDQFQAGKRPPRIGLRRDARFAPILQRQG